MPSAPQAAGIPSSHRCERCGVESAEPTCFVLPERHSQGPRDIRCLMCEQARATSQQRGLWQLLTTAPGLLIILFMVKQGDVHWTLPLLLSAFLVHPIAIIAHELGHALTAKLLGLEIGAITIGFGPLIARFELGSIPVHLHAWPFSGFVHLGAATRTWLRTRAWLTAAAGPLTNTGLMVATAVGWSTLEPWFGDALLTLWFIANFTLLLAALLPHQSTTYRSDGQQLRELPRAPDEHLDLYLSSALLVRSLSLFNARHYVRAKAAATQVLERVPDSRPARILISANNSYLGDHTGTLEVLAPLLSSLDTLDAPTRAAVRNNTAFALIMSCAAVPSRGADALQRAEQLSADAFAAYPCALSYRSTRALVLTALDQASEALAVLQYVHYEFASATERSHREGARAFAWHRLGRTEDALRAAQVAVSLNPAVDGILNVLLEMHPASVRLTSIATPAPDPRW